jgi:hypothetical protein
VRLARQPGRVCHHEVGGLARVEIGEPHLDLILDGSRSMNLEDTAKAGALAQLPAS